MSKLSAVGLFSGCGGLDLGAHQAGYELVGAYDSDPVAVETYRRNVSPIAEVVDLSVDKLGGIARGADLVLGGPPCQGFSSAGPKNHEDERNKLWTAYIRALALIRPKAFLVENVYGFMREFEAFREAVDAEFSGAYAIEWRKINSQFYGVPQQRLRLFVVGVRRDIAQSPLWPSPLVPEVSNQRRGGGWRVVEGMVSMESCISDLGPAAVATNSNSQTWGTPHEYVQLEPSHRAIAPHIPNGGSLRSIPDEFLPPPYKGRERTRKGWAWYYRKPDPLLPARTVTASLRPIYSQVLAPDVVPVQVDGDWSWDVVDPREHTSANGLYTSPVTARRLTVREAARLQTFPEGFEFFGSFPEKHRQIGNAVPVQLAKLLCEAIAETLRGAAPKTEAQPEFRWKE